MQRATPPERQGDVATALMDGVQVRGLWQSAGIENGYTGHALVIDPWGTVLADAGVGPGVAIAPIDTDHLQRIRAQMPSLRHRRPALF